MLLLHFALTTALGIGVPPTAPAQPRPHGRFGLQAGPTLGSVSYVPEITYSGTHTTGSRVGFAVGVVRQQPLGRHWLLVPGLRYLRTGFTEHDHYPTTGASAADYTAYQTSYALSRVEVPVEARFFPGQHQRRFFLAAGASVGVLLGGRRTYDVFYTDGVQSGGYSGQDDVRVGATYPLTPTTAYYLRRWDAGLRAGLGYQLARFAGQASYQLGLLDVATASGRGLSSPIIHDRLAELQLTYLLAR